MKTKTYLNTVILVYAPGAQQSESYLVNTWHKSQINPILKMLHQAQFLSEKQNLIYPT